MNEIRKEINEMIKERTKHLEPMEQEKKKIKKILANELGDMIKGRFYMNKRQMEMKQATIYIGNYYNEKADGFYKQTSKEMNDETDEKYDTISSVLKKYSYSHTKEIKSFVGNKCIDGEVYIRIFFE